MNKAAPSQELTDNDILVEVAGNPLASGQDAIDFARAVLAAAKRKAAPSQEPIQFPATDSGNITVTHTALGSLDQPVVIKTSTSPSQEPSFTDELCGMIQQADDALSAGDKTKALGLVRQLASLASPSYRSFRERKFAQSQEPVADVTEAMVEAGKRIASELITANVCKQMNGLGGGATWQEYQDNAVPNFDLIESYVIGQIDSVTAIYLAMERAKC